jgi:hypothetical protein
MMSSDAAKAMWPNLADKEPSAKGQGSTWGVNAAEAMYGKKEGRSDMRLAEGRGRVDFSNVSPSALLKMGLRRK